MNSSTKAALPYFAPEDDVDLAKLVKGAQIARWTEALRRRGEDEWTKPDFVTAPAPCCGRLFRKLPTSTGFNPVAWCCACQLMFRLHLIDENDGGYLAIFTVEEEPDQVVVASHRRTSKPSTS